MQPLEIDSAVFCDGARYTIRLTGHAACIAVDVPT